MSTLGALFVKLALMQFHFDYKWHKGRDCVAVSGEQHSSFQTTRDWLLF
jgi:hypothetical protein